MPYTLPAWQDAPSPATPISAANLTQANTAINSIDSRLTTVETGKVSTGLVNAQGNLISANGAGIATSLLVGGNGQVLTADSSAPVGLKWATPIPGGTGIDPALITAKGDLIGGTGASAPATIPKTLVNGRVLTFDTSGSSSTNIKWAAVPYGSAQDEGIALPIQSTFNFIGAGVTATDDSGNLRTNVTIPGGSGVWTSAALNTSDPGQDTFAIPRGPGNYVVTPAAKHLWLSALDGNAGEFYEIHLCIVMNGTQITFSPRTTYWKGITTDQFGNPNFDLTSGTTTFVRLTLMDTARGFLGEV